MKNWLYQGRIQAIEDYLKIILKYKREKTTALEKLQEYFGDPTQFQYEQYKNMGIPIGSGIVESAIRRVINLRIKGPGTFWYRDNAEKMIFMRAQILTGSWNQICNYIFNKLQRNINKFVNDLKTAA